MLCAGALLFVTLHISPNNNNKKWWGKWEPGCAHSRQAPCSRLHRECVCAYVEQGEFGRRFRCLSLVAARGWRLHVRVSRSQKWV